MRSATTNTIAPLLFFCAMLWYSWFLTPLPGSEINSRTGLASSMVLDHRAHINRYFRLTENRVRIGDNFYSDQAPGAAWLATPALTAWSFRLIVDPGNPWQVWAMAISASALPSALLTVLLFLFVHEATGRDRGAALAAAAAYAFATPAFAAATVFSAAQPAAAMLFCMFLMGYSAQRAHAKPPFLCADAAFGFLFGAVCVTDYASALAASVLAVWYIITRRGRGRMPATIALTAAGAMPLLFCWAAYNQAAFGRWAALPMEFYATAGSVSPAAILFPLWKLLAASPFLILAAPGLWRMHRNPGTRPAASAIIYVLAASIAGTAINAAGGTFEQHALLPALPFCAAALGIFLSKLSPLWRGAAAGAAGASAAAMLAAIATDPLPPAHLTAPFMQYQLPLFLDGYMRPTVLPPLAGGHMAQIAAPVLAAGVAALLMVRLAGRDRHGRFQPQPPRAAVAGFMLFFIITAAAIAGFGILAARRSPGAGDTAIAKTLNSLGRANLARARFNAALRANPKIADAHYGLGMLDVQQGLTPRNAITHFRDAVHYNPAHAGAHYQLALSLESQGRARAALRHYLLCANSGEANINRDTSALVHAALLSDSMGRTAAAARLLQRAQYTDPFNHSIPRIIQNRNLQINRK
jgi:tetratricopeptide (TPR) repeat protein